MALFDKRTPFEKITAMLKELSGEEKTKVKAMLEDVEKAEDEREIDKIEEEKADNTETKDEKAEEVREESEEIGKKIDETEETEEKDLDGETEEESGEETEMSETEEEQEREDDVMKSLDARLKAIEEMVFSKSKDDDDAGLSGYGRNRISGLKEDTRQDDLIKMLGGRA